jgi:hypothetical protein
VLLIGSGLIDECFDVEEKPTLDILGVLLSSLGLFSLVFGVIESSTYGWWKATAPFSEFGLSWQLGGYSVTPIAIAVGLVLLAAFLLWERHVERAGRTPLVSLELFSNRQFMSGALTTGVIAMGQAGLIFSIPVFLQAVRGADAFHTGLALVPSSIAAFFAAPAAAFLTHRIPAKRLIQFGLLLNVISYALLRQTLNVNSTPSDLILGLVIQGTGLGIVLAQINNLTLSAVSVQQAGEASGVNNTFRQLGSTLGTAVIGALLISTIGAGLVTGLQASAAIPAQYKAQITSLVSKQSSAVEFGGGAQIPAAVPQSIKDEITKVSHQAITDANRQALLIGTIVALFGLLASAWLPSGKDVEAGRSAAHRPQAEDAAQGDR